MIGSVGEDIEAVIKNTFTYFDIDSHFGDGEDLKRLFTIFAAG